MNTTKMAIENINPITNKLKINLKNKEWRGEEVYCFFNLDKNFHFDILSPFLTVTG
jgi:hypothetical protein